ncbi:69 kDa protein [Donkey orchid symptomless virus]|uniref:69 kDa protein n=1 Tax=Donkey orchid symptomless virus TaxID=1400526 RepID=V5LUF9_9VIRU|nr:69 kDa protein [Donkey orchid symptomless virus]AHA56693.1 69 kDa protein [Donkey orchid symptomless virus]
MRENQPNSSITAANETRSPLELEKHRVDLQSSDHRLRMSCYLKSTQPSRMSTSRQSSRLGTGPNTTMRSTKPGRPTHTTSTMRPPNFSLGSGFPPFPAMRPPSSTAMEKTRPSKITSLPTSNTNSQAPAASASSSPLSCSSLATTPEPRTSSSTLTLLRRTSTDSPRTTLSPTSSNSTTPPPSCRMLCTTTPQASSSTSSKETLVFGSFTPQLLSQLKSCTSTLPFTLAYTPSSITTTTSSHTSQSPPPPEPTPKALPALTGSNTPTSPGAKPKCPALSSKPLGPTMSSISCAGSFCHKSGDCSNILHSSSCPRYTAWGASIRTNPSQKRSCKCFSCMRTPSKKLETSTSGPSSASKFRRTPSTTMTSEISHSSRTTSSSPPNSVGTQMRSPSPTRASSGAYQRTPRTPYGAHSPHSSVQTASKNTSVNSSSSRSITPSRPNATSQTTYQLLCTLGSKTATQLISPATNCSSLRRATAKWTRRPSADANQMYRIVEQTEWETRCLHIMEWSFPLQSYTMACSLSCPVNATGAIRNWRVCSNSRLSKNQAVRIMREHQIFKTAHPPSTPVSSQSMTHIHASRQPQPSTSLSASMGHRHSPPTALVVPPTSPLISTEAGLALSTDGKITPASSSGNTCVMGSETKPTATLTT